MKKELCESLKKKGEKRDGLKLCVKENSINLYLILLSGYTIDT
jgi:hypothetical protein